MFTVLAIVAVVVLLVRRKVVGGELGGPKRCLSAGVLIMLWLIFIVVSSLYSCRMIGPFQVFETDLPSDQFIHFHHKAKDTRMVWVTPKYSGENEGWLIFDPQKP